MRRLVALFRRQSGVVAHQLKFVEDGVLAFLLPVIEEYVLEQLGELSVGFNALTIVERGEQLDIQGQLALAAAAGKGRDATDWPCARAGTTCGSGCARALANASASLEIQVSASLG
jgi:hypothetical protein